MCACSSVTIAVRCAARSGAAGARAHRFSPITCSTTSATSTERTGRQPGCDKRCQASRTQRVPRCSRARSNWRRFHSERIACSACARRRRSTATAAPSQRSAGAATAGAALQRAGCAPRRQHLVAHQVPAMRAQRTPLASLGQPGLRAAAVGGVGGGKEVPERRDRRATSAGTTRSTEAPAFSSARGGARASACATAATQAAVRPMAAAPARSAPPASSSSSCSSSTPTRAARSLRGRRSRQRDAMPADVGVGQHPGHDAVGLGQQRRRGAALARHVQAVGAEHVGVFRRGITLAIGGGPERGSRAGKRMTRIDIGTRRLKASWGCSRASAEEIKHLAGKVVANWRGT